MPQVSRSRQERRLAARKSPAQPPPSTAPVRPAEGWWLFSIAMCGVLVLTASLTIGPITNNDIWIHLKTGELILRDLAIPGTDPYSFTASDHQYLCHEWLSAVVFHLVYRVGGVLGLTIFKFLVILAMAGLLFATCRVRRDHLAVALPAFVVLGYVGAQRYLERPHIFTFLFSALYLFLFFKYRDGGRHRAWLLSIIPLHVIWANLHSGFYLGLMLLVVFAGGAVAERVRDNLLDSPRKEGLPGADVALLAALPFLCALVSLINPHGIQLLLFPFQLTGMEEFMSRIFEWKPPFDRVFHSTYMFYGYWVWVVALVASVVALPKDGGISGLPEGATRIIEGVFLALIGFFAYVFMWKQDWLLNFWVGWVLLGVVYCLLNFKRLDFTDLGLITLALALSVRHNRNVADAITISFPVLTCNLSLVLDRIAGSRLGRLCPWRAERVNAVVVSALSTALIALAAYIYVYGYWYDRVQMREKGLGIASNMPVCAVDYAVRRNLSGNAYTSYTTAALLILRRYPEVKVNMDSRNEVYGPELFLEYMRTRQSPEAMEAYLDKYPVDLFLVRYKDFSHQVMSYLMNSGKWVQVFFDDLSVVLLRKDTADPKILESDAYEVAFPTRLGRSMVPAKGAEKYLRESTRAIENCPEAWLPWWIRVQALVHLKRPNEAIEAIRESLDRRPKHWVAWYLLGTMYESIGEQDLAIDALGKALEFNPGAEQARTALKRLQGS